MFIAGRENGKSGGGEERGAVESREEEGQGQAGPPRGDVGRARGLRLVAEVVGAVAVGLRLEQVRQQQQQQQSHLDSLQTQQGKKTRPENLVDAIPNVC